MSNDEKKEYNKKQLISKLIIESDYIFLVKLT